MAYTKTNWQTGDVIDATKLNHAEDGIAQAQETADTANARDSLADLTDVEITTPTDGQVILYDATNSKWVNGSAGGGGAEYVNVYDNTSTSSAIKLTVNLAQILELINSGKIPYMGVQSSITYSDSDTSRITIPIGKYFLTRIEQYSSTYVVMFGFYHFVGTSHSAIPKMNMMYNTIAHLNDIDIGVSLSTGDVLVYNYPNKKWQSTHPTMSFLTDTQITSPTSGQILKYNGSKWVNGPASPISMAHLTYYRDDSGDYGDAGVMYMAYAGNPSDTPSILDVDGLLSLLTMAVCTGIDIYDTTTMDGSRIGSTTSITLVESTGDVYVGDSHLSNHYKADGSRRLVLQTT